jgi:hypothetical protein
MTVPYVYLKIENCKDCPHCYGVKSSSTSNFFMTYKCSSTQGHKIICKFVPVEIELYDKDNQIPDWCPLWTNKNV